MLEFGNSRPCSRSSHCPPRLVSLCLAYSSRDGTANVLQETCGRIGRILHRVVVRRVLSESSEKVVVILMKRSAIAASIFGLVFRVKTFLDKDQWYSAILFLST